VPKIKAMVDDGCAYEVENALVAHNDPKYQCTGHHFKLNLIDKTKFTKVEASNIPVNHFVFVAFRNILEEDREDKHLSKIVIVSVLNMLCFIRLSFLLT
jgi:hypothetical protein